LSCCSFFSLGQCGALSRDSFFSIGNLSSLVCFFSGYPCLFRLLSCLSFFSFCHLGAPFRFRLLASKMYFGRVHWTASLTSDG
jgi:hypothetical protein